jgi:hypothetical protein
MYNLAYNSDPSIGDSGGSRLRDHEVLCKSGIMDFLKRERNRKMGKIKISGRKQ